MRSVLRWRAQYAAERLAHQLVAASENLAHVRFVAEDGGGVYVREAILELRARPRKTVFGEPTNESLVTWELASLVDSGEYRPVEALPLEPGERRSEYLLEHVRTGTRLRVLDLG